MSSVASRDFAKQHRAHVARVQALPQAEKRSRFWRKVVAGALHIVALVVLVFVFRSEWWKWLPAWMVVTFADGLLARLIVKLAFDVPTRKQIDIEFPKPDEPPPPSDCGHLCQR